MSDAEQGQVECRCASVDELSGSDAQRYAEEHLVVEERYDSAERYGPARPNDPPWWADRLEEWRGTGFGELICASTGWRFQESWTRSADEYRIRRRPFTTRADYLDPQVISARAEEVGIADALIDATVPHRDRSEADREAWRAACDRAHLAWDALYSPDFTQLRRAMSKGDPEAIEAAMVYLEVDPWVFRSGYYKQKVIERLARAPRSSLDQERLEGIILAMVFKGERAWSEWHALCRLCRHLSTAAFEARLRREAVRARSPGHERALLELAAHVSDPGRYPGRGRHRRTARGRPGRRS